MTAQLSQCNWITLRCAAEAVNATVQRAMLDALPVARASIQIAESDTQAAQACFEEAKANFAAVVANSAAKIEPLAREFLNERRSPEESPLDFIKRVSKRVMELNPAVFGDSSDRVNLAAKRCTQGSHP